MKRKILLLLCVFAMIAMCLASCDGGNENAHEHSIEHVEAKAATCSEAGHLEYWRCSGCKRVWADEALTKLTTPYDLAVDTVDHEYDGDCDVECNNCGHIKDAKPKHSVEHVEAVEATCIEAGNIEYWQCTKCEKAWTDKALTKEVKLSDTVVEGGDHKYFNECDTHCMNCGELTNEDASHVIKHVDAKDATCSENGNVEYWYCTLCSSAWTDAALTEFTNLRNVIIGATDHEYRFSCDAHCMNCGELTNENASHRVNHVSAKDATCSENGNVEYWYCTICNSAWTDADLTRVTNLRSVVIPTSGHEYRYPCDAHCMHCGELTNENVSHNVKHVSAVAANCSQPGNIEYWYCADCGSAWTDAELTRVTNLRSVIIPAGECNAIHVEAVAPGCHYTGNVEYWICYGCERVWADEALTQITNVKNVIVPALGGDVIHVEANQAGCHQTGNIEYWYCAECEQVWQNEALTQLTNFKNVITPATVGLTHVAAVEANCHQTGCQEYWYCSECDAVFADAAGKYLTNRKNLTIPATAEIVHVDAVEASCHQTGNVEYWYCADCDAVFTDAALTQLSNRKNVVIPATAGLTHVAAVEANCHQNGCQEYWYCSECDAVFADAAGKYLTNRKNLTIPATAEIVHVDAVEANCHQNGNVEYWYCADCNAVFTDAALTKLSNFKSVVVPATVGLTHVVAVEANCHQTGCQEYWYCSECDAVFADAAGKYLTNRKNLTIPATAEIVHVDAVEANCHQNGNVEYWYCADCNAVFTDAALTKLSNFKSVIVPCTAEILHIDAVEANCHQNGNVEYWYCADCNAVFTDAALTKLSNFKSVIVPCTAEIVHIDAVEANCHQNGNVEYWYCADCNAVFTDAALTKLSNFKSVVVPATAEIVHVDAVEANCHQNGNVEYWYCADCNAVFTDAALTKLSNFKSVIVPCTAEIVHIDAVEASCHQNGNVEYWYCADCNAVFTDAALTKLSNRKNVVIPALGGELVHVEESCYNVEHWYCELCETVWADEALTQITNHMNVIKATPSHELVHVEESCYNVEHWYCELCETVWADEALTQITNHMNVIKAVATHNLVHVGAVAANCHQTGNVEYWYCNDCETVWADEALTMVTNHKSVIVPAIVGLTHVAAVEANCHQNGCQEYWYCSECDAVFADAAGKYLTNRKNLTIPATAEIVHIDAVEANCHQTGNVEYWYCADCNAVFTDAALTKLSNFKSVVVPYTAEIVHVDAVEASCHQTGNVEYWYCADCNAVFTDAALTKLSNFKSVVVPATAEIVHVDAVEANCHQNGNVEYWYCSECDAVFADAAGKYLTNRKNLTIPATAEIVHMDAVAPGCHYTGNVEYWFCADCDAVFTDAALTQLSNRKNVVIPALGGELVHVEESCYNVEHWYCELCETVWADEALTQITNHMNVIKATPSHELVHVEALGAGCNKNGNIEHWYCDLCETVWADEALTQITNHMSVILPGYDHNYVDYVCSLCGQDDPDHYFNVSISEANAANDGKKIVVSGTVCTINTIWSDTHGNISVTIVDAEGNKLYVYRLATKVELGDVITVTGVMATYQGNRQVAQGSTATIDGHDTSYDYVEMTVTDAIAAEDNTNVIVTGEVVKIDIPYDSYYGNISVYIADENGNRLYVYRLAGEVVVGDIITVKGSMATYQGNRQITGGTVENKVAHVCTEYVEATCVHGEMCIVCGAEISDPYPHLDENGDLLCDYECGSPVFPAADTNLSIEDAITLGSLCNHNEYSAGKYYVTGTVTEIKNTTYGNMYLEDEEGNTIYVYGFYNEDGSARFDKMDNKPQVGDVITVYTVVGQYNSTVQLKNAWLVSIA